MIYFTRLLSIICILIIYNADNKLYAVSQNNAPERLPPPFLEKASEWADSVFNSLTPEERIGQLFMIPAYSDDRYGTTADIIRQVKEYNIGGIIFMQGGPLRQAKLTNKLQSVAKTPLMVAMDAEWGLSMRLDSTFTYPRNITLGAISNNELIYDMGADMARQLNRLGVHVNFAPVIDVNVNPANPVIGNRAFGENVSNVTEKGLYLMRGMQDNNILAVGKHFPGHGDTDQDSHFTLPHIRHTRERFDSVELVPFRELINSGLGGIMTAHLYIPAIDSVQGLASSLSVNAVEKLLKSELGFEGLVFTDALNMSGVSDYFSPGQLEIQALLAGSDVLLFSPDVDKAVSAVKRAVRDNILTQELIDERCRKILIAKYWMGLDRVSEVDTENLVYDLNSKKSENLFRDLTRQSLTLVKNQESILPLKDLDTLKIASVSVGTGDFSIFQETLSLYAPVTHFNISKHSTLRQFDQLISELETYNLVIVGVLDAEYWRSRQYGISPQTSYFIRRLKGKNNVVLSMFTSPYGLAYFDDLSQVRALIVSYDDNNVAQEYSAQIIFGGAGATGRLPVTPVSRYPEGSGIDSESGIRLGYTYPERAGLDSEKLAEIDSIVKEAIAERATPGAQVLIARKGQVVYHKTFGYHTYRNINPVTKNDLYDLASVTKIAASVPALMKLVDDGRLDLKGSLGEYLPHLRGLNKEGIVIKDILTHQARLQPWIPFFYDTFEPLVPGEELFSRRVSAYYPYMLGSNMFLNKNYIFADSLFSDRPEGVFTVQVADRMYMNSSYLDTIYKRIDMSDLRPQNRYLYSDVGFYYIKSIIESITSVSMDTYLENNFYNPLGAERTTFLPLKKYPAGEIVPTENDNVFRRQLLRGHVHDAGTAMIGGVGGHAGLFSNANDLAKLFQMFLQGGNYGGLSFVSSETIDWFTSAPNSHRGNRRGIGFDKVDRNSSRGGAAAESASLKSYGHTGFTGTMVWVDPVEELVYIFLSNRVHPDQYNNRLLQMNVRSDIHQVIYDSILD